MYYYEGSRLTIEWTNQHGCGTPKRMSAATLSCSTCATTGARAARRKHDRPRARHAGRQTSSMASTKTSRGTKPRALAQQGALHGRPTSTVTASARSTRGKTQTEPARLECRRSATLSILAPDAVARHCRPHRRHGALPALRVRVAECARQGHVLQPDSIRGAGRRVRAAKGRPRGA